MEIRDIERKIERAIPGATARVTGADAHYSAHIVAPAFEGKALVDRHRMVYAALQAEMKSEAIHALSLKTLTPTEAAREGRQEG